MKRLLRFLGYLLLIVVVLASVALLAAGWIGYRALPQLDGTASLPELKQEVTVDRDTWGVPRIRASSLEDLVTAQGYVQAQDRLWQMDLIRRAAAGELAEIFGRVALLYDRESRVLGLRQAAERDLAGADAWSRALLVAYARGVNRYVAERRNKLPWEFRALGYQPRPWTPVDSLLVGAHMYRVLTTTWEWELTRALATVRVGPERARELFAVDSPRDHFLVGAEGKQSAQARAATSPREHAWHAAQAVLAQLKQESEQVLGSNNWVVDGKHTYSGKPILANDTHLPLDVPCIWYMIHLTAPGWNVKGFTLPGSPLVILGHNERTAWGFTNNGADVQDLYIETLNPANPQEYRVNGRWVSATIRKETIKVKGQPDHTLQVVSTRHGPIVFRQGLRAYALRWTATEPGGLNLAYPTLGKARDWQEFRTVARQIPGPAQNIVYADVEGNIGYLVAARIPVRKRGDGSVPVPGDTDDYEWTGYIPFDELPQVLNPPEGMIATANARVVGPGYRWYLTDRWAGPHRTERIYELLAQKQKLRPADCIAIQTDVVSLLHRFVAEQMLRAARDTRPRDPRTPELLAKLNGWDGRATADSVQTAFVEYTRRALMRNLLRPHLGDEYPRLYEWWRHVVFLENVLRDRPAQWLPKGFRSYDELLMASADEAVGRMEAASVKSPREWRWGRFHALEILHPFGRSGLLRRLLSIGPIEQGGTTATVWQTTSATVGTFGPAQRFVADLADWDNSLMNIAVGQSGQYLSPHYRDQFPAWFQGRGLPAPFSDAAVEKARVHRLILRPAALP